MESMQNSASSCSPSSVVNVQCQNVRNSTCSLLFHLTSRLRSRTVILMITFIVYTILGAVMFAVIEKTDQERRTERRGYRNDRKRFELMHRIDSTWKKVSLNTVTRKEWFNETGHHFRWFENELKSKTDEEPFWTFPNALLFSGASICTTGFQLNVLKTTAGRAFFICFSTLGVILFYFCTSRLGYFVHKTFERLLLACQRYRTGRPQIKSLLIYILFVPTILAGQNCAIYYLSQCSSYFDVFQLHFYSITTVGHVDLDNCLKDNILGRLVVFICILLWTSTVCAFMHSFDRQRILLYEYLSQWLKLQTDENLFLMSASVLYSSVGCSSRYYSGNSDRLAFIKFLRTALGDNLYHKFLLKTLNCYQMYKLCKLYRKISERYSQATQTDRTRLMSRGTLTRPTNFVLRKV